jgi:hypothetical protein
MIKQPKFDLRALFTSGYSFWEYVAIFAFMLGMAAVLAFANIGTANGLNRLAVLFVIACASWMVGSMLGFLFGVPRFKSDAGSHGPIGASAVAQSAAKFTPNTNLEQISDWLTKIIVGATLVQLRPIAVHFAALCVWIGGQIGQPSAAVFVGGLILFLFFAGLLWGYLWCSIRIFREMLDLMTKLEAAGSE